MVIVCSLDLRRHRCASGGPGAKPDGGRDGIAKVIPYKHQKPRGDLTADSASQGAREVYAQISGKYFDHFEPYLQNIEWVKSVFEVVERSRNVIMHSGSLSDRDMARLGSLIRDWNSQVSI